MFHFLKSFNGLSLPLPFSLYLYLSYITRLPGLAPNFLPKLHAPDTSLPSAINKSVNSTSKYFLNDYCVSVCGIWYTPEKFGIRQTNIVALNRAYVLAEVS